MQNRLSWATAFAAGLLFIAAAPSALADSLLYLSDSNGNYVEVYNGVVVSCNGCTTLASGGNTTSDLWDGSLGAWSVNIDSGVGFPPSGNPLMDLSIQDRHNDTSGDTGLLIEFATQVFDNYPGYSLVSNGSISGAMTVANCAGNTNSCNIGTIGPTNGPIINLAGSFANPGYTGDLYQFVTITDAGANSFVSDDFRLSGVPEPTSIVLLGGALLLAGRSLRRKFQKV
ncbi:MAG TPA: PEP-CTERM sorting domain-containing protein [Bryobacteraceae bacterium]|nr:PEP-CTERM sorting domain-containing protein [Bryobacteraceae bacterium]